MTSTVPVTPLPFDTYTNFVISMYSVAFSMNHSESKASMMFMWSE